MSAGQLSFRLVRRPDPTALLSLEMTGTALVTVVRVSGELDLSTAHLLTGLVDLVVGNSAPRRLVLDLSAVSFFAAVGVSALVHARNAVSVRGGALLLREPSRNVRRVLALTGDLQRFAVEARQQAVR
jgi:anti-anti-sigma factor